MEISLSNLKEQLAALFAARPHDTAGRIRIVFLQRGNVVVGRYYRRGCEVTIEGASVVRRWGTTKGIGEIAVGGPTDKTVLDPCLPVRVHELGVVAAFDCDQAKWRAQCK